MLPGPTGRILELSGINFIRAYSKIVLLSWHDLSEFVLKSFILTEIIIYKKMHKYKISPTEIHPNRASLRDVNIMRTIPALFKRICDSPAYVAVIPSLAVIIDYSLTFFLAGSTGIILQWEASPLVRFAVAHDIMAIYLFAIVVFYYGAAYAVLHILHSTCYYRYGVTLVILVSVTHILGGLSWQFKNSWYSNAILYLSFASVIIAICLFGYTVIRQECSSA